MKHRLAQSAQMLAMNVRSSVVHPWQIRVAREALQDTRRDPIGERGDESLRSKRGKR